MQVQFYLLQADEPESTAPVAAAPAHFILACSLCADLYRQNQRVLVYCANQQDAELLDELLWRFDADRFVPHNLTGEGPPRGAPVEISWQAPKSSRQVLINLTDTVPAFANRFSQIIEFVPTAESAKELARQKYKQYRQLGVTPQTIGAS